MIRFPAVILERIKIPRVIFSIRVPPPSDHQKMLSLMKKGYEMGVWCFDLPSTKHLESFKELRRLTDDETLVGLGHVEVEHGVSFFGKPLHQFETKVISTISRNFPLSDSIQVFSPGSISSEVFTQKEIDRITFDPLRFDKTLTLFNPKEFPFLLIGEKYGEWLLALGRIDILKEMTSRVRELGFIPIFSGQWATYVLPKAKPLDVAAYAIPINKKWSLFNLAQACNLIKKFDKPVISLNPLVDGKLLINSEEAFSFLFDELKILAAIPGITSEEEFRGILEVVGKFPPLIHPRKT